MNELISLIRRARVLFDRKAIKYGLFAAIIVYLFWIVGARHISVSMLHEIVSPSDRISPSCLLLALLFINLSGLLRIYRFEYIQRFTQFVSENAAQPFNFLIGLFVGLSAIMSFEQEFGLVFALLYVTMIPVAAILLIEISRYSIETNTQQIAMNYPTLTAKQVALFDSAIHLALLSVWVVLLYRLWQ